MTPHSNWNSCPICGSEVEQASLGAENWAICAKCGTCEQLGVGLWTPPHLTGASPQDFGADSWDSLYAGVLARLSALRRIDRASSVRNDVLRVMRDKTVSLLRILDFEASGVRDGDGAWHGSDPLSGTVDDLKRLCDRLYASDGESGLGDETKDGSSDETPF